MGMRASHLFVGFLLIAFAVFFPSLRGEFIMDDWGYITLSPHITDTTTPFHFWVSMDSGPDYWPLSYTFYWLFFRLFGLNPLGYHLVNVVLHACNGMLVFFLARRFAPKMAAWAGLLFLVHPMNVQAVSWIIQFKTLLSTALALSTVLIFFKKRPGLSAGLFALSLLAKSSSVFLPFVLWVLDNETPWKIRSKKLAPFFALSLLGGTTTLWSNHLNFDEFDAYVFHMHWFERPLLAAQGLMFYLRAFVWPHPLSYLYPHTVPGLYAWTAGFDAILLLLAGVTLTRTPGLKGVRAPLMAYWILLIPCLGFVLIPNMKLSLVADHWAYLPNAFLVSFVFAFIEKNMPWRWPRHALAAMLVVPAALLAHEHARTFATEEAFWRQAVEVNPESPAPYYNLGTSYDKQKKYTEALNQYRLAVQKDPLHARAWYNSARDHYLLGNLAGAREGFNRTIEINPQLIVGYISLSKVHMALLNKEKAVQVVKQGLAANPDNAELIKWLAEIEKEDL